MGGNDDSLRLFHSAPHACGYWPDREARDLVLDPRDPRLAQSYAAALAWGFRRSGDIVYRPSCGACRACVAVRIPVADFTPDRSQRRCMARNSDLQLHIVAAASDDEYVALYQAYLHARHRGGGMDDHGRHEFEQFLIGSWNELRFLEFRRRSDHRLLALAVTDLVANALSAVYTFYDPAHARRGLGTLAVLSQVELARRTGRSHVYLGYWIKDHAKMDYKRRFRPLEAFDGRRWLPMQLEPEVANAAARDAGGPQA